MTTSTQPPIDLAAIAADQLDRARAASSGRAATTLTPGVGARLAQTILALAEGRRLDDHTAPGPATLQVLEGRVTVTTDSSAVTLDRGQWSVIPDEAHGVLADRDAVLLLTIAPSRS